MGIRSATKAKPRAQDSGTDKDAQGSGSPAQPRQVQRTRRRPLAIVLCLVLAAVGATVMYSALSAQGQMQVLVTKTDVARGDALSSSDLSAISVSKDTRNVIPYSQLNTITGKRAAVDLPAGSLVTGSNTATSLGVSEGSTQVGIGVTPAGLPGRELVSGDKIRIVYAPADANSAKADQSSISGTVEQTSHNQELGLTIVDVRVPTNRAEDAARWSASGSAAIVLDPLDDDKAAGE